jgi:hypothetical protein
LYCHPMSFFKAPRRTPREAIRGKSSALRGSQSWLTMMTMTKKMDDSDKEYVVAVEHGIKRQAWLLIDHFEKLLEAASLNHAYPIRHKLKDCNMMKYFMTLGSLSQGKEPEGDPSGKGTTPFPREEAVMTVYDGRPREVPYI